MRPRSAHANSGSLQGEPRNEQFGSGFGPMTIARPRLAFGMAAHHRGLLLGGFTRSSASCRTSARSWLTAPMAYLRTSVTTRFGERLGFLGRGTATEAMYSLTLRRTSRIRSASDFAGRATLIILQAIRCLLSILARDNKCEQLRT